MSKANIGREVILVDDNEDFRLDLATDLERENYTVHHAADSQDLRQRLMKPFAGVILLDVGMPGVTREFSYFAGFEALNLIKGTAGLGQVRVIMLSVSGNHEHVAEAVRCGALGYLLKSEIAKNRGLLLNMLSGAFAEIGGETGRAITVNAEPRTRDVLTALHQHLRDPELGGGVVELNFVNRSKEDVEVAFSTWIEGVGRSAEGRITVAGSSTQTCLCSPRMRFEDVRHLDVSAETDIGFKIDYNHRGKEKEEKGVLKVRLLPPNTIRWSLPTRRKKGNETSLAKYIAVWVTPGAAAVDGFLSDTVQLFSEEFQATRSYSPSEHATLARLKVKAFYNVLKHWKRIRWPVRADARFQGPGSGALQRVQLPEETLDLLEGNCIDRAVLFASLIEAVDLNPVIVLLHRHALVGWEPWKGSNKIEYLETTLIESEEFEKAVERGSLRVRQAGEESSVLISISKCREEGIVPMNEGK